MNIDPEVQETVRLANVEIDRLRAEVERLKQYERGELVPGSVVSEGLDATDKWVDEEREACAKIVDATCSECQAAKSAAMRIRARRATRKSPSEMHVELSWYGRKEEAK